MWVLQGPEPQADAHHPVSLSAVNSKARCWKGAEWGAVFAEQLLAQGALGCPHVTFVPSATTQAVKCFTLAAMCCCSREF